jgi:hypothetical protein
MKSYLGIRDIACRYAAEVDAGADRVFGIDPGERNFARVRVAEVAP